MKLLIMIVYINTLILFFENHILRKQYIFIIHGHRTYYSERKFTIVLNILPASDETI